MKVKKIKEWAKEHELEISIGAACLVDGGLAILGVKGFESAKAKNKAREALGEKIMDAFSGMDKISREIDEDIFTDLAPKIERVVLDRNIENVICIEHTYDLGERLTKYVTVTIRSVYGD